jgi:DHA3 family macrolide efflux protein-like MFS transporter
MTIHHRVATIFVGKVLLGIGFVVLAFSHVLWMALLGSAFAAIGGPMGDIMSLLMIQTDLPSNQVGKVYSLRMILESAGSSLGLVLAAPLFAFLSISMAITVCALLMMAMGIAGLLRFGLTEPIFPQLDLRPNDL